MSRGESKIVRHIILLVVAAAVLVATRIVSERIWKSFDGTLTNLNGELAALPFFDRETEQEIMKSKLGLTDAQLNQPPRKVEEVIAEVETEAKKQALKNFTQEAFRTGLVEGQERLRAATPGQTVTFKYRDRAGEVRELTGTYEYADANDVFINGRNIPFRRVLDSYRHLFSPELSVKLMADHAASYRANFERQRKDFFEQTRDKLLKGSGLLFYDGQVGQPADILELALQKRAAELTQERSELIEILRQKYKLWNHIYFTIADGSTEKNQNSKE
ncbi:MAG: hypothetical protein JXR78_06245 [Victivallales bacterium]|nr:hypothetical protein [Victivallales bacterium]